MSESFARRIGAGLLRPFRRRPAPAERRDDRATRLDYAPSRDGDADPGEVVWAWVPFEEDASRGKDRPVLVVARDGRTLVGALLTSKDHDRDRDDEARWGRVWIDVGSGGWDVRRRPSEARLDRMLRLSPDEVRRQGAALSRDRFDEVVAALRDLHGWG